MSIAKKKFKKVFSVLLSNISYIIPKKNKKILFKSKPDYSGNAKAICDHIIKNNLDYEMIWSVNDVSCVSSNAKVQAVSRGSFKELYHYLTSKVIITTHNEMIGAVAKNQKYISLWHGMPLKKICYLGEFDHQGMEDYSASRIATSEIMRSIISASFREKANKVYITGQPRNDYLFEPVKVSDLEIQNIDGKKIVIYVPTFRQNNEDEKYSDGQKISGDNFFRVNDFNLLEVDDFLDRNNCHLLIKLHPYEESSFRHKVGFAKNITILDSLMLAKKNIDVNQILPLSDCLITDYSSVYFDYLILNKPMIFLVPDLESYRASRGGFTLEPFDFWAPGDKVINQNGVLNSLKDIINDKDQYLEQRKIINDMINLYVDNKNSERVIHIIEAS